MWSKANQVISGTLVIDDLQRRYDLVNVVTFAHVQPSKGIRLQAILKDIFKYYKEMKMMNEERINQLKNPHASHIEHHDVKNDRK